MNLKRIIFRIAVRGMEWLFLRRKFQSLYHSNLSIMPVAGARHIDIVTIAFNNSQLIGIHNEYVRKYLKGDITHIVVDNSTDLQQSGEVRSICENTGIGYVRLHRNWMGIISGSYSHAAAVNWTYKHIIRPRNPFGFGIIDHDIFPVKPIEIASYLSLQPVYGAQRKRNEFWYLSAIISFFRTDYVKDKKFDFMPVTFNDTYLDSGGGNWSSIYSKLDEHQLRFMSERMENFQKGENRHQDQIELFDDAAWVHTINGSYWKKISVVKEDIISELLVKYEYPSAVPSSHCIGNRPVCFRWRG